MPNPPAVSPNTEYPHLLATGRIGTLTLRNRILLCPMGDLLGRPNGTVSERQAAYYEARARGGAALLLVGSVAVAYPRGSYDARQVGASEDRMLPGLTDLARRAHAHGAAIAAQLVHDGAASLADAAAGRPRLVPSPPAPVAPDRLSRMVTAAEAEAMMRPFVQPTSTMDVHEATEEDLAWVIERFVDATRRLRTAGFDAVELHAGHGYLIDSFLSPASNRRTDRWGGDVAGRARLLTETVRAIRADAGSGFPLWCRLNAVEHFRPGGETIEDAIAVAGLAVEAGVDAVHVSAYADPGAALGITEAHTPIRPGALLAHAAAVKATVPVPVITFGRLEPDQAEAALAAGHADFVAMGRKLLADPDLPAKLAAGAPPRPCIYQYRCIGNIFIGENVACVVNAATGHEDRERPSPVPNPRRVLVVGGGPAGLEAAAVLAHEGHAVTLWEADGRLGGRLVVAGLVDPQLERLRVWLVDRLHGLPVEVALERPASVSDVVAGGFDEVVVATGARWDAPVPGPALTVDELEPWLRVDGPSVGRRVAVLGGGKPALAVAGLCADRGRRVTLVAPDRVLAPELGLPARFRLVHDVEERGVEVVAGVAVIALGHGCVEHAVGTVDCDTVIAAAPSSPRSGLVDDLAALGVRVRSAGDCRSARGVEGATTDAEEIALAYR